ncbi:MAG: hypothetical protein WBD46_05610 [Acidobacteriaceae bacterium]
MTRIGPAAAAILGLLLGGSRAESSGTRRPGIYVQPCRDVTLTASYLAEARPGAGPGFLFRIENHTSKAIRLAEPVPSSTDWYAQVGERWMWRASAGTGGSLVNALEPRGPMFAGRPESAAQDPQVLTVAAHGAQEWIEAMRDDAAIAYRPSCAQCNYPGETQYEAIFAYAWLAKAGERAADLLRCGLRSAPVPMPPKALGAGKP